MKEVNWLGDIVMSLPALRALRSAWPQAHLSVLVRQELASFFAGFGWIDEVIPYAIRRGWAGWGDRKGVIRAIRERRFDLAVLFPNSFESAFWPALARVPRRAGFVRDGRGLLLTHKARPTQKILQAHQVGYYLYMLERTLGVAGDPAAFEPEVEPTLRQRMAEWLDRQGRSKERPLIALAVAAAYGPAKEWPAAHFAALADLLAEKDGALCVLVGAPGERGKCEAVAALARSRPLIAAGETSAGEALALLALCDGFAGNDSGSMHMAGALGLPTVGLYGSTRADRTGPLGPRTRVLYHPLDCSPCLKRTCRFGHYDCLRGIDPAEVRSALQELGALGGGGAGAAPSLEPEGI